MTKVVPSFLEELTFGVRENKKLEDSMIMFMMSVNGRKGNTLTGRKAARSLPSSASVDAGQDQTSELQKIRNPP